MKSNSEWQLIDWEGVTGDSRTSSHGDPGFTFVGPYVSSMSLTVDADSKTRA